MTAADESVFAPLTGGCHCGAVRYAIRARPRRCSVCCCADCRRSAGAPMVAWAVVAETALEVTGVTAAYNSSGDVRRLFCPTCGTGLFYRSDSQFPGEVDVRAATLDDPNALRPEALIQLDDAPGWLADLADLPRHGRFPEET